MTRTVMVMLAGTLRASPLREQVGMPILCLPVQPDCTLLDAWHGSISSLHEEIEVRIVVSRAVDLAPLSSGPGRRRGHVSALVEPSSWRGTAGLLRDVTADLDDDAIVFVAEANALPPVELSPLLAPLSGDVQGVVGATSEHLPVGVYALRRRCFQLAPAVGYFDLKEQLLPALNERGMRVLAARLNSPAVVIRDRRTYLQAVRERVGNGRASGDWQPVQRGRARGVFIIEPGVHVGRGAIIHDSVIMAGAHVGEGAIVSRSVIGPGAAVEGGCRVIRGVLKAAAPSVLAMPIPQEPALRRKSA